MSFKPGDFVRGRSRGWIALVLDIGINPTNYLIEPVNKTVSFTAFWWPEQELESASLLEALAEASS